MKKIIAIIAVILVVAAGIFFIGSRVSSSPDKQDETTTVNLSDLFFVQYCVYAPESASVTLDGEMLAYNENIDCFSTEVKKEGNYTLRIDQEGCELIEETVYISAETREYTPDFSYTDTFISDGQKEGKRLIEELMQKCWSLSYDLSEYNFTDEETKIACEAKMADLVAELEENLSADYTTGELRVTLTPVSNSSPSASPDSEGSSILASFSAEYSFDWQFSSDSYKDSGSSQAKAKPYIIIENRDGEWYIRDFYLSLSNGTM